VEAGSEMRGAGRQPGLRRLERAFLLSAFVALGIYEPQPARVVATQT
jgi:hypothetical protein